MDGIKFNRNNYIRPVTTGAPQPGQSTVATPKDGKPFSEILAEQINSKSNLSFSKHALQRVATRSIDVSESSMERLSEGVKLAAEKGLGETLILVDKTAFIVNAGMNKVITAVTGPDLLGSVFTNIEGTVII